MVEIRWHGRGGQGAKTASNLLALAQMASGLWVQAFPEYGPERSGAPMVAYNRADAAPIRRHDGVSHPDLVVVLDRSLWAEVEPLAGLAPGGHVLVNAVQAPPVPDGMQRRVAAVPGDRLARESGIRYANVVMAGAALALLGQGSAEALQDAVRAQFGRRLQGQTLTATIRAAAAGFTWAREEVAAS
jgi:pyruvate ferredoxin oxidoreductase gamma subunit